MINGTTNIAQYVIGGAVIFVLIALMGSLIALAIMKKRGSEEACTLLEEDEMPKDSKKGILDSLIAKMTYCEEEDEEEVSEPKLEKTKSTKNKATKNKLYKELVIEKPSDKKELIFTKIENNQEEESFRMILEESLSIGRGMNKNDWVITNDQTISQKHCKLYIEKGIVYMIDLNTTNGTFVNKKRMTKPVVINSQDRIRMGVSEYRITIRG
ncbi:MAG: FHA domain-containing protein [Peptostreptococcaceae bacterium]